MAKSKQIKKTRPKKPLEVDKRQLQVLDLLNQGLRAPEIEELLNKPKRTIARDIKHIREYMGQEDLLDKHTPRIINELNHRTQMRIKRLWQIYASADDKKDKMQAMKQIKDEDRFFTERLQMIGLLPKSAQINIEGENIQFNQNIDQRQIIEVVWGFPEEENKGEKT